MACDALANGSVPPTTGRAKDPALRSDPKTSKALCARGGFVRGVALVFQFESQFGAAAAGDAAVYEYVNFIRHDVVEQALVVRYDQHSAVGAAHRAVAFRHNLERVDIEAGVGFVQDRELRLEHSHLQDLVALFLAA